MRKIALYGTQFMDELLKEVPIESIPVTMGGKLPVESWSYEFDTAPGGLFCADRNHVDLDEVHLRNEHKREFEKNMLSVAADNASVGGNSPSEKKVSGLSKKSIKSSRLLLRLSGSDNDATGYKNLSTRTITEIQLENMKIIYKKNIQSVQDQDGRSSSGTTKSSSEKQSTHVHIPAALNGIISSVPNTFNALFNFNVQHSSSNTTSLASSPNKQSILASRTPPLFPTEADRSAHSAHVESVAEINRRTRIHHLSSGGNHHHHHDFAGILHTSILPKFDGMASSSVDAKRRKSIAGHQLSPVEESSLTSTPVGKKSVSKDSSPKQRPFSTSKISAIPFFHSSNVPSDTASKSRDSPLPEYPPRKSVSSVSSALGLGLGFGARAPPATSGVDNSDCHSESTQSDVMFVVHADSDDGHSDTPSAFSTGHEEVHGRVTRPVPQYGQGKSSLSSLFESATIPVFGAKNSSGSSKGGTNARVQCHLSESASIHLPQPLEAASPSSVKAVRTPTALAPPPKQYTDQSTQTDMTIPAEGNALIVYDFQSLGVSLSVLLSMSPIVTVSAVLIAVLSLYGHNFFATLLLISTAVYGIYIAISY